VLRGGRRKKKHSGGMRYQSVYTQKRLGDAVIRLSVGRSLARSEQATGGLSALAACVAESGEHMEDQSSATLVAVSHRSARGAARPGFSTSAGRWCRILEIEVSSCGKICVFQRIERVGFVENVLASSVSRRNEGVPCIRAAYAGRSGHERMSISLLNGAW